MNIAPFTYEILEQALENAGVEDAEVRTDYSGRGMYGATCFGIVHAGDSAEAVLALVWAVHDGLLENPGEDDFYATMEVAGELARAARGDNMGLSRITYFPGWSLMES